MSLEYTIIALYCVCDDFLKSIHHYDCPRAKISQAEILTILFVATLIFHGNITRAYSYLKEYRYMGHIHKSQLFRRLDALDEAELHKLLDYVKHHSGDTSKQFLVDSFPVEACRTVRISRCKLYQGEDFRGYCEGKKSCFYAVKEACQM